MLVKKLLAAYRVVQYYLLTSTCRGFEWSGLGKNSPYPKKYGVSEYHADGNRYRCMGLTFTHWLDMAVTVLRTPVSGLPFLFRGHSYQLSFKQIPVALSRSYGGVPSGLPAPVAVFGWVLSPTWFAANFGLQSLRQKHKSHLLLRLVAVPHIAGGRRMSKWPSILLTATTTARSYLIPDRLCKPYWLSSRANGGQ